MKSQALMGPREWLGMLALGVIAISVIAIIYRMAVPSDEQVRSRKVSAALLHCQQSIASAAQYGGAEMPPYTKNYGTGDEFYFAWQRGSFEFKNGFGASIPMSASCIGTLSTGEIQHLTINGKDVM